MSNQSYWSIRFTALEKQLISMSNQTFKQVKKLYDTAITDMDKELAAWYQRFADENGVVKQPGVSLSPKELKQFRLTIDQFLSEIKNGDYSENWERKLNNAYISMNVSRLQALQMILEGYMERVFNKEQDLFRESLLNQYTEGYYRSAFILQKGVGIGTYLGGLDENKLTAILAKPWASDKKNFSQRIWKHRGKLKKELDALLTQAVLRGDDYSRATKQLAERMNVSRSSAGRLILTESAFVSSKSHQDCFRDLGVERYQFIATLDTRTSEICRDMDLKVFPMSAFKPGSTAPPLHCYCRSCTAPYFEDMADEGRIARGSDGKTFMVPGDMTYREWQKIQDTGGTDK